MTQDEENFLRAVSSDVPLSGRASTAMADAFLRGYAFLRRFYPHTGGRADVRLSDVSLRDARHIPDAELAQSLHDALEGETPSCLAADLLKLDHPGRIAVLMRIVDSRFRIAHPSQFDMYSSSLSLTGSAEFDLWVRRHDGEGDYARISFVGPAGAESLALVPRGPLRSDPVADAADRGANLHDLFAYLCVVGKFGDYTATVVRHEGSGRWNGPAFGGRGAKFSAVPVCTEPAHIEFPVSGNLVRPGPTPTLDMDSIAASALAEAEADGSGMVVFPEFVAGVHVSTPLAKRLAFASRNGGARRPAIWICGTSLEDDGGTSRNRCRILNGDGHQICLPQDKLHPNYATRGNLKKWTGTDPGHESQYFEDFAGGSHVMVIDDDAWGRIIVLICEDLKQVNPRGLLCGGLRPDWLVAPILDGTIYPENHWAEKGASDAAGESGNHSRVFVVNAVSSARNSDPASPTVLFAIGVDAAAGRLAETDDEKDRSETRRHRPRVRLLGYELTGARASVPLEWQPNSEDWKIR